MSLRRIPIPRVPPGGLPLAAVATAVATMLCALAFPGQVTQCMAAASQTLGVLWLAARGLAQPRTWATATFVAAASWTALFVVPSWIFAIDPQLLDVGAGTDALLLVNISLFAAILGWHLPVKYGSARARRSTLVRVKSTGISFRRVVVAFAISAASLAVLFGANGGPVNYFQNLDRSGEFMAGLTYVFWGLLAAKFAGFAYVATRWAQRKDVDRRGWLILAGVFLLLALHGSRGPLVIGLAELCLIRTLTWKRIRIRTVVAAVGVVLLVVVFGIGAVKRYQKVESDRGTQRIGYVDYLLNVAPRESISAYATNYADQVRLIAVARSVVPARADYEYGRMAQRVLFQPIPRYFRPATRRDPDLAQALYPSALYAYAVPLQADAYIQFGVVGVVVLFLLLGTALRRLDLRLNSAEPQTLRMLLVLVAATIAVALILRSGLQGGLAFGVIEIAGFWLAVTLTDQRWSVRRVLMPFRIALSRGQKSKK